MIKYDQPPPAAINKAVVDTDEIVEPGAAHSAPGSQTLQFVAASRGRPPTSADLSAGIDEAAMRTHIEAGFEQSLGQMLEYQRFGYNRLFPKVVDLHALKTRLLAMKWRPLQRWQRQALQRLETPLLAFLDKFRLYSEANGLQRGNRDLVNLKLRLLEEGLDEHTADYELFKQANLLAEHIGATLDLMPASMFYPEEPSWNVFEQKTRDRLLDEVLPVTKGHSREVDRLDGHVTRQFDLIVHSATWDERGKREALGSKLRYNANKLLVDVKLRARFADEARGRSDGTGLVDYMHDACEALPGILEVIKRHSKFLTPSHVDPAPITDSPKGVKGHLASALRRLNTPKTVSDTIPAGLKPTVGFTALAAPAEDAVIGLKNSVVRATSKMMKTGHRAMHALSATSPASNQTILTAGLILLDTLQQTMSNVGKAKKAMQPLREAVALEHELRREALHEISPALGNRLRGDASSWQTRAEEAEKNLVAQLDELMPLAQEGRQDMYLSDIRDQLNQAPLAARDTIDTFDKMIKKHVERVVAIQSELCEQTLRLGKLGMAGSADFYTYVKLWSEQLTDLKDELKRNLVKETRRSANNFSGHGMLSRGWAEQAEANKRRYLDEIPEADRAEAAMLYERLFFETMEDHLPLFAKETDPEGQRLLARLRLELGHAARGTTIYPATMAEILAGVKSTSEEIRAWSRKRLVSGLLLGISMGTFSLLGTGWRVTARVVSTGYKVAATAAAASKGIRLGQGKADDELLEYAKRSIKTVSVKLVVSSIPGLSTALGVGEVVWDAYEGGIESAVDKILQDVAKEVPLMPVYEARQAIQAFGNDGAIRLKDYLQQMLQGAQNEAAATDSAQATPIATRAGETLTPLSVRAELSRMSQSDDPERGPLAARLQAQLGDAEGPMARSNLIGSSHYNVDEHRITLGAEANDWVMLHEIAHSLTARKLRLGLHDPDSSVGEPAAEIEALRERALKAYQGGDGDIWHYLSRAEEFVAGLYSGHSDFLDHLRSLDSDGESLWSLLMKWIGQMLGISDAQQSALSKAMSLTDEVMGTALTDAEAEAAIEFRAGEVLFSAPVEVLPGWKRIGQFNRVGRPVPFGEHVELTFGYEGGGTWHVIIEIPQSERGWPAWKHYIANYLNIETALLTGPWRRPVRVGEAEDGNFQAASPGSAHEVFVPSTSSAQWMIVDFAEQPSAESNTLFIRAPAEAEAPIESEEVSGSPSGFNQIGMIDESNMSFPPDKQLHLHFARRNGGEKTFVIDIPQDKRADGQWQRYAVDYINYNLKTVELGALHAEVSTFNGVGMAKIYAGNSDITRVDWSFNARTQLSGSDLEFRHRDRYLQEGTRIIALLADKKVLEAERSQALDKSPNVNTLSLDKQIENIAAKVSNTRLVTQEFYTAANAETALFLALTAQPEAVGATDNPVVDALANAKAHSKNFSRQLSAIQAYRARLASNSRWTQGEEPGARELKLDLLQTRVTAQMKLNDVIIPTLEQQLATEAENTKIRARNLARSESAKRNYARALELQTERNRVGEQLKNAWRFSRHQKVLDKDLANMPAPLTAADIIDTAASRELLATRDRIAAEIVALNATIKEAEDAPIETESPIGGAPAPFEAVAEPEVSVDLSVSQEEFEGLKTNAKKKLDGWIIESAQRRGLDITLADLDKSIVVQHNQSSQTRGGVGANGAPNKNFSLRQILLGEADRSISVRFFGSSGISFIDVNRGFLEETTDPILLFLRGEFGSFPRKVPNRMGVASDVMANVDAALNEYVQRPQVQAGFKVSTRGNIMTTLIDDPQAIDEGGYVYQQILKGFMARRLEATPVYVKGTVVPGVAAIGEGDYRIIVSLDQRKFILFNALAVNKPLAAFLNGHLFELDKNKISEADVSSETSFTPREGFTTRASREITFGKAQEDGYITLLRAYAEKLKSYLGGAIYTREEAADDLDRDVKKAVVASLGVMLTFLSSGASAALQFKLGVMASVGGVVTDIYIDNQNAINADRLSDKLVSERNVRVGKMLAGTLILPFLSKLKMHATAKEVVDYLAEVASSWFVTSSVPDKDPVSIGPVLPEKSPPSSPQETSDSHALASKRAF